MSDGVEKLIRNILRDVQVELGDEFDRNFERQAFFSKAWQRRKSPTRPGGSILIDTGNLRRSIKKSTISGNSITFSSDLPYAAIQNDGGDIKVTAKMKRYFWHKYYAATGSFGRRKDGSIGKTKRNAQLSTEAEFWKAMALMKIGSKIHIPERRFLGVAPEVEKVVREIIDENVKEFMEKYNPLNNINQ